MQKLGTVLRMELKKAFCSKKFIMGLGLLLLFSVLSAVYMIEGRGNYNPGSVSYYEEHGANPDLSIWSFFTSWLAADDLSYAATVFFWLLPIGTAIPFSWSYYLERKNGYLKNVYTRINKGTYLAGKAIAVFLSGAAVVAVCFAVNILLVVAKIPVITPFAGYNFYNHVYFGRLWADLYFNNTWLFVLLVSLLNIFYGGVFALFAFAAGFYFRNIFAVLFSPFLLMILASYIESVISQNIQGAFSPIEWVPVIFLRSQGGAGGAFMGYAVAIVTALLLGFSLLTIYFRGVKRETL